MLLLNSNHNFLSSHGGFLTIAMYHQRETMILFFYWETLVIKSAIDELVCFTGDC